MTLSQSVDRFFSVSARGSTFRTEIWGGVLVFMSMCYIIAVNPNMMADAGMDRDAAYTATILMSVIGTLSMALYAKYPVSQAPTMGVNAFFVYSVVIIMGFTWQQALAATFIAGIAFLAISLSGARKKIIDSIPDALRYAVIAGIGCFIVFIGIENMGLIVADDGLTSLGNLAEPSVLLGLFCILITLFLYARKVTAAVLIGMIVTVAVGICAGVIAIPSAIVSMPVMPDFTAFLDGFDSGIFTVEFLVAVVALTFMQFFDSTGTLLAAGELAGLKDSEGRVNYDKALVADAAASVLAGVVGTTPTGSYAESAVGVEAGARTGLASLVVAFLFFLTLFIGPLFGVVTFSCTVGAMMIVGAAMIAVLKHVTWQDWPETVAVMTTILFTVLAFSIVDGIAFGVISYCVCMIGAGRWREVSLVMHGLAVFSLIYFITISFYLN